MNVENRQRIRIKALELALKLVRQPVDLASGTTPYNAQDVVEDAEAFLAFIYKATTMPKEPEQPD